LRFLPAEFGALLAAGTCGAETETAGQEFLLDERAL